MRQRNLDIMGLWESLKINSDKLLACMYIVIRENEKYIPGRGERRRQQKRDLSSTQQIAKENNKAALASCFRKLPWGSQSGRPRNMPPSWRLWRVSCARLRTSCWLLANDARRRNRLSKSRRQASDSLRRLEEDVVAVLQRAPTSSNKKTQQSTNLPLLSLNAARQWQQTGKDFADVSVAL